MTDKAPHHSIRVYQQATGNTHNTQSPATSRLHYRLSSINTRGENVTVLHQGVLQYAAWESVAGENLIPPNFNGVNGKHGTSS